MPILIIRAAAPVHIQEFTNNPRVKHLIRIDILDFVDTALRAAIAQ